ADFALGAFYLGVVPGGYRLYGGLSMLQAYQLHVSGERPGDNGIRAEDLVPHYYFLAGSVVNLTNWTFIEPSVWMRYTPDVRYYSLGNFSVPVSMNLNVRYQMLQRRFTQKRRIHGFWIGLGGATSREVMVEAGGLMIQEQDKIYKLGLAYSFQLSSVVQLGPTLELNGSFSL
ncbi:MAG: type IX secretion system membrane protein PorP/SprF, partial [Lewinella sp.]|nr:type IX secretion system membrane protein PorP/SprF [Lewinella sp.]